VPPPRRLRRRERPPEASAPSVVAPSARGPTPVGTPRGIRDARAAQVGDFDGCRFKLVCAPEALGVVTMHVDLPCWRELSSLGGQAALDEIFAGHVAAPDPGYKVAVRVDCDAVAAADRPALLAKLIDIKRHLVGAPFADAFAKLAAGTATKGPVAALPWREGGEAVYVMAGNDPAKPASYDRVAVVYAIDFPEETDRAMGRVLLQQFAETRVPGAPPVTFSEAKAPPLEIRDLVATSGFLGFGGKKLPSVVGYVTLTVFKRHVDTPEKLADRVGLCVGFRNYLHYHIKAAKTNQHMRMRRKVYSWLQILNRAVPKPAAGREMKTATGRSFFRKK